MQYPEPVSLETHSVTNCYGEIKKKRIPRKVTVSVGGVQSSFACDPIYLRLDTASPQMPETQSRTNKQMKTDFGGINY